MAIRVVPTRLQESPLLLQDIHARYQPAGLPSHPGHGAKPRSHSRPAWRLCRPEIPTQLVVSRRLQELADAAWFDRQRSPRSGDAGEVSKVFAVSRALE